MPSWNKAYHANCWGALGGAPVGVTSIKDLYYRTFGDMNRAIADIGAAGYKGIELFDGNLLDYEGKAGELRSHLADAGLNFLAVYSGGNFIFPEILSEELWRIRKGADLAAELGAEHLVVGGGAQRTTPTTEEDYRRLAEGLNQIVKVAEERGMTAHYHPHLTTMAESPEQIRKVFDLTSIHFCPDTAHLAAGGGDPAKLILEHADRITYVHLKDLRRNPFTFLPLGEGELDMDAILQALVTISYAGWLLVELDSYDDPKAGAEIGMRYLTGFENRVKN
ncbi:MAG: sugar phosphate isomerase/epimerase [Verrucomicrobia bacterium]|nr:sugar phosphate isomerase/epimerase [Verrucomicrobiota bacterium]